MNNKDDNLLKILRDEQKKMPNIILPSMGLVDNTQKINIDSNKYIFNKNDNDFKSGEVDETK